MPSELTRRNVLLGAGAAALTPVLLRPLRHHSRAAGGDPRDPVFDRADLIYGSQFWWSKPVVPSEPAFAMAKAARIRAIRFQNVTDDLPLFKGGIAAAQAIGAVPFIGIPPIGKPNTRSGPHPWNYTMQQWTLTQAVPAGVRLFEMANEPNNYQKWTAGEYFANVWVNVPRLKAYARSQLGTSIYVGGPATTGFCSSGDGRFTAWLKPWLDLCQQQYDATGNHDWMPDYVTVHCYGGSTAGPQGGIAPAMADLARNFDRLRGYLNTLAGPVPGSTGQIIKMVNSEYNIGIQSNIGNDWQNQSIMNAYYDAIFKMASAPTVDGSQRVWMMNQFCVLHGGHGLDLLNPDGTARPAYHAFTARSAG